MGEVRDIRSARPKPPTEPDAEPGRFAEVLGDVRELVGVATASPDSPPWVTLDAPPAGCEGWCLTPGQAAALSKALADAAQHCRDGGGKDA